MQRTKRLANWSFWLGAAVLLGAGYWMGRLSESTPVAAQQSNPGTTAPATSPTVDASKRVVAYIYGTTPITREEFGDYLIELYQNDRLEFFVNKKIIEIECAKHQISVTSTEIEAAIGDDCKRISIGKEDFVRTVLKRYNKTIEEWKQEVMKPRLLLAKLVKDQIPINDDEILKMYENRYGEKVKCKLIIWPKGEEQFAQRQYDKLRSGDAGFDSVARQQKDPNFASRAGEIEPIGRHSGSESAKIEEIAFTLKDGEVSQIIQLPFGACVIKRTGMVPAIKSVPFERVKEDLRKEVLDRKLDKEVPKLMFNLQKAANPQLLVGSKRGWMLNRLTPPTALENKTP